MADLSNSSNSLGTNPKITSPGCWWTISRIPGTSLSGRMSKTPLTRPNYLRSSSLPPVAVKDIWGLYGRQKKSFVMSTGFQVVVVLAALWIFSIPAVQKTMAKRRCGVPARSVAGPGNEDR